MKFLTSDNCALELHFTLLFKPVTDNTTVFSVFKIQKKAHHHGGSMHLLEFQHAS